MNFANGDVPPVISATDAQAKGSGEVEPEPLSESSGDGCDGHRGLQCAEDVDDDGEDDDEDEGEVGIREREALAGGWAVAGPNRRTHGGGAMSRLGARPGPGSSFRSLS